MHHPFVDPDGGPKYLAYLTNKPEVASVREREREKTRHQEGTWIGNEIKKGSPSFIPSAFLFASSVERSVLIGQSKR